MDFFDKQAHAESRTRLLIAYFLLAVVGIILTLHVIFCVILHHPLTDWKIFSLTSVGVTVAVAVGSLVKSLELSEGGRVVAAMLGGVPVDLNSTDPAERRLIHVVEEMSLASGVPMPELFILNDPAINAFAAGHGPGDTAIGVTRGCIEHLTRDELQGVIGHEFSHILHGDMKLNIRLIGILNGILFLALMGGILLRLSAYAPRSSSRNDDKNSGSITVVFIAAGMALHLVGWVGVFFGKLIKAAVSRQREFLADASSVQYTRNPNGLAGALAKISKFSSRLESPRAEEASHLFFGNGLGPSWLSMFETHPPIQERIAQIAPGFDMESVDVAEPASEPPVAAPARSEAVPGLLSSGPQVAAAAAILSGLPEYARTAARELHGACSLVYALLLSDDGAIRARQLAVIDCDDSLRSEAQAIFSQRGPLKDSQKIALVDIAIPTLRHLSNDQFVAFRANVKKLIAADGEIDLFEFALQKILFRHLDLSFSRSTGPSVRYRSILPLLPDAGTVLSALAIASAPGDAAARDAAFTAGVAALGVAPGAFPFARTDPIGLPAFEAALDRLAEAAPDIKRTVLTACEASVLQDGATTEPEFELLRAIADSLDCPIPPAVHPA